MSLFFGFGGRPGPGPSDVAGSPPALVFQPLDGPDLKNPKKNVKVRKKIKCAEFQTNWSSIEGTNAK